MLTLRKKVQSCHWCPLLCRLWGWLYLVLATELFSCWLWLVSLTSSTQYSLWKAHQLKRCNYELVNLGIWSRVSCSVSSSNSDQRTVLRTICCSLTFYEMHKEFLTYGLYNNSQCRIQIMQINKLVETVTLLFLFPLQKLLKTWERKVSLFLSVFTDFAFSKENVSGSFNVGYRSKVWRQW